MSTTAWLLRDGVVLANAEVAATSGERFRGLLGRSGLDGALVIPRTRSVHSFGMRFAIDVAFLDRSLQVLDTVRLAPWRMTLPRLRARSVLEAEAGAFERWGLRVGDALELRDPR
ncbi:MAG TPA: DUF192 domain-containing protein [Acidimicrobiales bacterium]|nr:DUF192 domain-containing protein [Acidimicrobiales bacterium]